jgi:hypothetical protein
MSKEIVAKEFKFGWHIPASPNNEDTHIVKERIRYKDGTEEDRLVYLTNVKRPIYTTKKIYRKYKQKKEAEFIHRLDKTECTDSELVKTAARKLGIKAYKPTRRDINSSPYLYGTEIKAINLIKDAYQRQWNMVTPYTISYIDIEADVDTNILSVVTALHRDKHTNRIKIVTAINKTEMPLVIDFKNRIVKTFLEKMPDDLPKNIDKDNLDFDIRIFDNESECIKSIFDTLHEWGDDILTGWNIQYDMVSMETSLLREGIYRPVDVFADPSVPEHLKRYEFRQGKTTFKKQNGKETGLDIEKQWHTYYCTAKFTIIDQMNAFYALRVGGKEIQGGYSLDNVLSKEVKLGKLKFDELTDLTKAEWHKFMLKNKPLEYVVYNIWDVLALLVLEEKNNDLSLNLPLLAGKTMFEDFGSSSKKIMDDFHFHVLDMGMVLGSFITNEDYGEGLTRKGWTVTLEPWKLDNDGYKLFKGIGRINNINLLVYDLDQASGYPSDTMLLGLSKMTTAREILSIGDIDREEFKRCNLNITTGKIADIDYAVSMFKFPTILDLDKKYINRYGVNNECKSLSA